MGARRMSAVWVICRAIEGWTDQLAIGKSFLVVRLTGGMSDGGFGWHGVERLFQIAPPAKLHNLHARRQNTTTLEPEIRGSRGVN